MGILRNKKRKYKIIDDSNDKRVHKELWISEKKAKRILIERELWDFYEQLIIIDMEFPDGYIINRRRKFIGDKFNTGRKWLIDNAYPEDGSGWEVIEKKVKEINEKLGMDLKL